MAVSVTYVCTILLGVGLTAIQYSVTSINCNHPHEKGHIHATYVCMYVGRYVGMYVCIHLSMEVMKNFHSFSLNLRF